MTNDGAPEQPRGPRKLPGFLAAPCYNHERRDAVWARCLIEQAGYAPSSGADNPYSQFTIDGPDSLVDRVIEQELLRRLLGVTQPDLPISQLVPDLPALLQPPVQRGRPRQRAFCMEAYLEGVSKELPDSCVPKMFHNRLCFSPTTGGGCRPSTSGVAERRRKRRRSGEKFDQQELARLVPCSPPCLRCA